VIDRTQIWKEKYLSVLERLAPDALNRNDDDWLGSFEAVEHAIPVNDDVDL